MNAPPLYDVLIIGAGPAGLAAAFELSKNSDLKIHILESHPHSVGGISRTEKYKDYFFDIGGHRFFSKSREIECLWREILPDDLLLRPRLSRIYYRRRFYRYPLRALEALRNLGLCQSGMCVLSYLRARLFPISPERSLKDWVSNRFGERLFSIFFKSYTEKVWGMRCEDLSADWAAQRIHGLNFFRAVIAGLTPKGGGGKIKTLIDQFLYPRQGPGMLWTASLNRIKTRGGSIDMGVKAVAFEWNATEGIWTVTGADARGGALLYRARHILSSAPLRDTLPALSPQPRCAARAKQLKYRDFLLVALILKDKPAFPDNWIYIHDPELKVGRIQNYAAWSKSMVPASGSCVGMEYFCQEGDDFWKTPDSELIALAAQELARLGLSSGNMVIDGSVVRQPKAYPVYDDAYAAILADIKKELDENYPTFHPIGRNGLHHYNNQDHAMMTGLLAARNILCCKKLYDPWNVNEDAEYHELGAEG